MFCSFAIFIDTVSKFPKNEQQHSSLPHGPHPPLLLISSLTPICLSSILVLKIAAKSFTNSLKSILPSANSPTILNLIDSDYVAIHTLCEKNKIFEMCKKLKDFGAEGIIVSDVNLMVK